VSAAATLPVQPPAPAEVPAWRLVATLAVAGAVAGLLIVLVFGWAEPRIQAHQAGVLAAAVDEVLAGPAHTERFFVHGGGLLAEPPAGADTMKVERVFQGFDDAGRSVGFAVVGAEAGFADVVRLIFGYDPDSRTVLGMKVLESKETPGLGDRIEKDSSFVGAFRGVAAPIAGVKPGAGSGAKGEVETITGATISSRVVILAINRRIEALDPVLRAHLEGGRP
jgi:Na+-translocating ferredoxin:NAD+ oxidoreductase subunit G